MGSGVRVWRTRGSLHISLNYTLHRTCKKIVNTSKVVTSIEINKNYGIEVDKHKIAEHQTGNNSS